MKTQKYLKRKKSYKKRKNRGGCGCNKSKNGKKTSFWLGMGGQQRNQINYIMDDKVIT